MNCPDPTNRGCRATLAPGAKVCPDCYLRQGDAHDAAMEQLRLNRDGWESGSAARFDRDGAAEVRWNNLSARNAP